MAGSCARMLLCALALNWFNFVEVTEPEPKSPNSRAVLFPGKAFYSGSGSFASSIYYLVTSILGQQFGPWHTAPPFRPPKVPQIKVTYEFVCECPEGTKVRLEEDACRPVPEPDHHRSNQMIGPFHIPFDISSGGCGRDAFDRITSEPIKFAVDATCWCEKEHRIIW